MQAAFQKHTDNAVSKTVNFCHDATRDDVAEVYRLAYQLDCKGVTIYRDRSRDDQVLQVQRETSDGGHPAGEAAATSAPHAAPGKQPRTRADQALRAAVSAGGSGAVMPPETAADASHAKPLTRRTGHGGPHQAEPDENEEGLWPAAPAGGKRNDGHHQEVPHRRLWQAIRHGQCG
ncbi:MAG: hypothetical protein MZU79_00785 [Anaerotruncus sp.]|nr:hypothetical protein [Anaerotruncus sp.]